MVEVKAIRTANPIMVGELRGRKSSMAGIITIISICKLLTLRFQGLTYKFD